ncbi:MAG: hypothetical protein M1457_01485 [bacterium]|nr:hypothetical protein [bacterium]
MADRPTMNARERYFETMRFGTPDRIPFAPGYPRKSTLEAWRRQGLPEGVSWEEELYRRLGIERRMTQPAVQPGVNFRMMPMFEEKVIERIPGNPGHLVVQDWMGNIVEISSEFDVTYLRNAIDFVTRKWHRFPVEGPADFEAMKRRYNPENPGRFPEDWSERCRAMRERDYVTTVSFSGPFWQLREWCGFEPLCVLFATDPGFVEEMVAFWTIFVARTLAPILDAGVLDHIVINEDMAFKEHPMISPEMTRRLLAPAYARWLGEARQAGVGVIEMDSDGRIDLLVPIWIECGFHACSPIEVAAGCDINAYRRRFGRRIAYAGGVDKRCIARGGATIEAELERIAPVIRDGGYLPGCDHGVPPDIAWPDFIHYARRLAELPGWLSAGR